MPNDDPGVEVAKAAFGYTTDCCARILRIVLMLTVLTGSIFSIIVMGSCSFLSYDRSLFPSINGTSRFPNINITKRGDVNIADLFEAGGTRGLYKYDPDGKGCTDYDIPGDLLPASFRVSRLGGVLGMILGLLAFVMILLEFVCCRFWCSRVLVVFSLVFAAVVQLMTFILFSTEACLPLENFGYRCSLDAGAIWSIVASAIFFLAAFLTCPTPKATPLVQVMRDMEKNSVVDPCCCFKGRTKEEIIDDNPELQVLLTQPPDTVKTANGIEYKQNYDSKAGVTLQDQLSSAYKRWVDCETVYEKTLDRFRNECADIESSGSDSQNKRGITSGAKGSKSMRGSSSASKESIEVEGGPTETWRDEENTGTQGVRSWRELMKIPPEDIQDDYLRRLASDLAIQREQSDRAKEDMATIQAELVFAMTPPEEAVEELTPDEPEDEEPAPWWRPFKKRPVRSRFRKRKAAGEIGTDGKDIEKVSSSDVAASEKWEEAAEEEEDK